jgi:asparagine synthase (glutamine-hydrolysing)
MCGVNGVFAYAGAAPARAELLATRDHMRRRGPDGAGEWWSDDRRVGLGHRRLAIIDLDERAAQPMVSADGALIVTFNGEIYNYKQLRAELMGQGARFRTDSDTEVLLHLYAREGRQMVQRLRGMFAFALFDTRRAGLLMARDPYGVKPLYYASEAGVLRFASQVKALLAGGALSRLVDPAGLAGFHLYGHVPEPFTLYQAIQPLPAGSTLWIDGAGVGEARPFASIATALATAAPCSSPNLQMGVRAAVLESVRHHLVADVAVGAFLSGGVDSGALVGLMRDAGQTRIATLTLAFPEFRGSEDDEAPLAEQTAALYGAEHTTRLIHRTEFLDDLPVLFAAMDQPSIDGINSWFAAKAARELGLKVVLSGIGGDELLAGYSTFRDIPRWLRCFGPLSRIPGAAALAEASLRGMAPRLVKDNPKVLGLLKYGGDWAGAYLLRRAVLLPFEIEGVMDPDFARQGLQRLFPLERLRASVTPDPRGDIRRVVALESANYLRNQLLRDADWAGMAHGLEIRTPLVDFTLLQTLAPHMPRMAAGRGKRALAAAPSTPLPSQIVSRRKSGFSVPTAAWIHGRRAPSRLDSRSWADCVLDQALARSAT